MGFFFSPSTDVCLPLVVNPVSCIGQVKPPSLFSTSDPGHLFTHTKTEPAPSNGEGWKFFSNVTVQPSAAPAPSVTQDFGTVNLSDLHGFTFPAFPPSTSDQSDPGSRRDGGGANGAGNTVAQEVQNTFVSSMGLMGESEIPEFPSFSDAQVSDVDIIDNEEFRALLGQSGLSGEGASASSACHASAAGNMTVDNTGVDPLSRNLGNGTWMNYPPSIASLLQNEQMTDTPVNLDDTDMLNSVDEDRLMSILNSTNQVPYLSGHPT